jgi:DNA topoisomerase IB
VSGEARDAGGKWTAGAGGGAATKEKRGPAKSPKVAQKSEERADDEDSPGGRFAKPKAVRGEMVLAQRVGKGKDAKIVLADGSNAPEHVQKMLGKIPPAWKDVQVAVDPSSEVQAVGFMVGKNGKRTAKTVYSDTFTMRNEALKFSRVDDLLRNWQGIHGQVQSDRKDDSKRDLADATWLMMEQATRPGSEADAKGTKKLFAEKLTPQNVILGAADKKTGIPKISLKVGDVEVPIRDEGARAELSRRIAEKQPLLDGKFWLKSHGATTLEGRHVVQSGDGVRLQFMGKESVWHDHLIRDPELAKMLLDRKKKAGDDGQLFGVNETKVRDYVAQLDGGDFLTKDLRTGRGNLIAMEAIRGADAPTNWNAYKGQVKAVADTVAHVLGNRWQQSLETYINPEVFSAWRAPLGPEPVASRGKKAKSNA